MVGSANGRSISAFTADLPRKESRTKTQAMRVPNTALMITTMADTPTVSSKAPSTVGIVIVCQTAPMPPRVDVQRSAARGSRTMRLRYRAKGGHLAALLDLGHDAVGTEELGIQLGPAAELADIEQLLGPGEVVMACDALNHRPVEGLGPDGLRPLAVQEAHELLCQPSVVCGRLEGPADGVLDQQGLLRHDQLDLAGHLLLGLHDVVLVADHHVSSAVQEGVELMGGTGVLYADVLKQLLEVTHRLLLRPAGLALGPIRR